MTPMTTEPASGEPDFERDVHFALRPGPVRDPYHEQNHLQERGTGGAGGVVRYYALGVAVVAWFGVGMGMAPGVAMAVVAGLVTSACVHSVARRRRSESIATATNMADYSNVRYRLRVIGRPERLRALGPLVGKRTAHFEPVIFRVARAHEGIWRTLGKMAVVGGVLLAFLFLGSFIAAMYGGGRAVPTLVWWAIVLLSGFLGSLVWAFLWPTYVRIVPGRLDILRYSFLRRSAVGTRSIDLRRARVLVRAPRNALVVLPGKDRGEWICTSRIFGARRGEFEAAILDAARSEEASPPLPDGELIG